MIIEVGVIDGAGVGGGIGCQIRTSFGVGVVVGERVGRGIG